MKKIMITVT